MNRDAIKAQLWDKRPEMQQLVGYFGYDHLPYELQVISSLFCDLALELVRRQPETPELTVCLRKLLEAKDCAVRNALTNELTRWVRNQDGVDRDPA
jgi:hypothetical protein